MDISLYRKPTFKTEVSGIGFHDTISANFGRQYLPLFNDLVRLLDGLHSVSAIYSTLLADGYEPEKVSKILSWLYEKNYIENSREKNLLSDEEIKFYNQQIKALSKIAEEYGFQSELAEYEIGVAAQTSLKQSSIAIVGSGLAFNELAHKLARGGIGRLVLINDKVSKESQYLMETTIAEFSKINPYVSFASADSLDQLSRNEESNSSQNTSLVVYCSGGFDEHLCQSINRWCLANSFPFISYCQMLAEIGIGPLVVPKDTPCFVCYNLRRKANTFRENISNSSSEFQMPRLNIPLGIDLLALDILKFITNIAEPITRGRYWQINVLTGYLKVHPVLKLPRCPECGHHKLKPNRRLWEEVFPGS